MARSRQPLILRLTHVKWPPLLMGILTSLFFIAIQVAIFEIEGIAHKLEYYISMAYFTLTTGYMVFISRIIDNNHRKGFNRLLGFTKLSEAGKEDLIREFDEQRIPWKEMLVPIVIGCIHAYFEGFDQFLRGEVKYQIVSIYGSVQILIIWIMIWQSTSTYLRNMSRMNRASRDIEIDLLNTDQLMPLTSAGVISVLAFTGAYALLFIQGVDLSRIDNPALIPLIPSVIWMIVTPLRGVRKRIGAAKEHEIQLIDRAIDGDTDALKQSRIGNNLQNINVVDLMTYKKLIGNTLEIPINVPTASRFIFYMVIPFLTWIAASIVDKFIDYMIG